MASISHNLAQAGVELLGWELCLCSHRIPQRAGAQLNDRDKKAVPWCV